MSISLCEVDGKFILKDELGNLSTHNKVYLAMREFNMNGNMYYCDIDGNHFKVIENN